MIGAQTVSQVGQKHMRRSTRIVQYQQSHTIEHTHTVLESIKVTKYTCKTQISLTSSRKTSPDQIGLNVANQKSVSPEDAAGRQVRCEYRYR